MQNDSYWENEWPQEASAAPPHNGFWIGAFLLVSLISCIATALFVPSGLGIIVGYQQLQEENHEAAILHFNRGLGYLSENYPELARAEFEIALKYDGAFDPARQKLDELLKPSPNEPAGGSQQNSIAAAMFDEARGLVAQTQWSDAIVRLEQLRTHQADYRQAEVNDLLYQAYVNSGKAAVTADQIELARERFDAALTIRNGDPEVLKQRELAILYLDGQQAIGYNWRTAVQKFAALYQQDPNYDDVRKKLFDAYIQYGDQAMKQNASCLAAQQYDGALAIMNDAALAQKRAQTMAQCKQAIVATPTPLASNGTENYVWKVSIAPDKACTGVGDISGFARDALGRALAGVPVGYYADGIQLVGTRTNTNGQYQFVLGKDPGTFHVVILGADGKTPATLSADVQYPGGGNAGCHIVVDWQKVQ